MPTRSIREGAQCTIVAYEDQRGNCETTEFVESLTKEEKTKFFALCQYIVNRGPKRISNTQKLKMVEAPLLTVKPTNQIRIFGLWDVSTPDTLVLFFGVKKKRPRLRRQDIDRGKHFCNAYLEEVQSK